MRVSLWIVVLILLAGVAISETVVVEECGMTRQEARDNALRSALEMVEGAYIKGKTKVENYMTVSDLIFSRVKGFVRLVEVLEEWRKTDDFGDIQYCVRAKVEVVKRDVEKVIDDLMEEVGRPTVSVVTVESYATKECDVEGDPRFFEDFSFKGILGNKGLEVQEISPDVLRKMEYNIKEKGFSPRVIEELVRDTRDVASYIIAIKVDYYLKYFPNLNACSVVSKALVKVLRTDTGKSVAEKSYSDKMGMATAIGAIKRLLTSPRSKMNIERIAEYVARVIYKDRIDYILNPKTIKVRFVLSSVDIASEVEELVKGLPNISNVKEQYIRGNEFVLSIQTYLTPDKLWNLMREYLKNDLNMDVVDVRGDTLVVKVNGLGGVVLKFNIDRLSTGIKLKKCLMNLQGIESVDIVKRSKEMYEFRVKTDLDVEELIELLEGMDCDGLEIVAEDVADDGSWILFSATRR